MNLQPIRNPSEVLSSPGRRLALVPLIVLGFIAGIAPFVDPNSFTSPVFEAIFDWAPPKVWGAAFFAGSLICGVAAATGAWWAYRVGNLVMLFCTTTWLAALLDGRIRLGYHVSLTAFGLWAGYVAHSLVLAAIRTPVVVLRGDPGAA